VSESKEAAAAGSEGNGLGIDPTAVALALDGASREDANSFLTQFARASHLDLTPAEKAELTRMGSHG